MADKIMMRHPKSDPPKDFLICFIYPQCVRSEYQAGHFLGDNCIYIGVELWCPWRQLFENVKFPDDHEPGKVK